MPGRFRAPVTNTHSTRFVDGSTLRFVAAGVATAKGETIGERLAFVQASIVDVIASKDGDRLHQILNAPGVPKPRTPTRRI